MVQNQSADALEALVARHASRQLSRRSLLKKAGALGLTASGTTVNLDSPQNNSATPANTYTGPWRFMALAEGDTVSWSTWRSAPYKQDAGSALGS